MFALPGIVALIVLIFVRPQEIIPELQRLPLLYGCFGLAVLGLAVDLRLRVNKAQKTPQLPYAIALFLWAMVSLAINAPDQLIANAIEFGVAVTLYVVIAHSVHTFRALQIVAGVLLTLTVALALIGVHQGLSPYGCVLVDPDKTGDITQGVHDGRSCRETPGGGGEDLDCYLRGEPEPGADYICEHIGLLGTTSVAGRVRYRGVLQDPNELALVLGVGLSLAFAFAMRRGQETRRRGAAIALAVLTFGAVATCIQFTQSRGGQLVLLSVLLVHALWRWKWKAVAVLALLAPVALLMMGGDGDGGRVDAHASTEERYEAWATGIQLFRSSPIWGIGHEQFVEHHYLTAHNSYVLALAETGAVGLLLWGAVIYLSLKIPFTALRRYRGIPEARVAVTWSLTILASFAAFMVGIFFLSFSWHLVLWIYIGLSGALYSAIRTHDPDFRVPFGLGDLAIVGGVGATLIAVLFTYLRARGY
jgi:hypothetical protein